MTQNYMDDEELFGAYDSQVAGRVLRYLRPYKKQVVAGLILVIIVGLLQVAGPLIVRHAIDTQIEVGQADGLAELVLLYVGVLIVIMGLSFVQSLIMIFVGQRVMMDMRLQLFSHVQRMAIPFFDRNPVGRLVTRLTNDVSTLEQLISQGVIETLTNLITLIAIIGVLLYLDWRLALVMLALVPGLWFIVKYFANAQRSAFREQRGWMSRINAYLNELVTGMTVVQLFNLQKRNFGIFDHRNVGLLDSNLKVTFYYAVFEPTVVIFNAVTTGIIIWFGGGRVLDNELTLGTLVAFLAYMQRFFYPIRELSERYTTMQQAMASLERVFTILDEPEEVTDIENPRVLENIKGRIEFRNVWFAYDAENWVLRDVSFIIEPGEKVAIVGATGAGKSTLMAILNRFYDVQRGEILVDGVPIRDLRQRELRRQVGLVLQDAFIFTDTVEENIRLRDSSISIEEAHSAARLVGADGFILKMRDGYSSLLAERGANLSTGQKQLIALARVAAFNPRIVLVMDEATASIDPETEATLQHSIQRVMQGRTAIVIAHRLNTIRNVDRILVLQAGRIIEDGSHAELLAARGSYFRLYELQYKDQDIALA